MKSYAVEFTMTLSVEADDEDQACEKACAIVIDDGLTIDDFYTYVEEEVL